MNIIHWNDKRLRLAQDLDKKILEKFGAKYLIENKEGIYDIPSIGKIAEFLNRLAFQGKIRHYILKSENEEIPLFDVDEIKEDLNDKINMDIWPGQTINLMYLFIKNEEVLENDKIPEAIETLAPLYKMNKEPFTTGPGIYFLCHKKEVVYIGQSVNIFMRVNTHLTEGKKEFDEIYYIRVPLQQLDEVECSLIAHLQPKLNGPYKKSSVNTEVIKNLFQDKISVQ